jgi:hypothetical protein
MAKKENKGDILTNEDLENELRRKSLDREEAHSYVGLQDTGDRTVRPLGTDVQRRDGLAPEDLNEEGQKDKEGG